MACVGVDDGEPASGKASTGVEPRHMPRGECRDRPHTRTRDAHARAPRWQLGSEGVCAGSAGHVGPQGMGGALLGIIQGGRSVGQPTHACAKRTRQSRDRRARARARADATQCESQQMGMANALVEDSGADISACSKSVIDVVTCLCHVGQYPGSSPFVLALWVENFYLSPSTTIRRLAPYPARRRARTRGRGARARAPDPETAGDC